MQLADVHVQASNWASKDETTDDLPIIWFIY